MNLKTFCLLGLLVPAVAACSNPGQPASFAPIQATVAAAAAVLDLEGPALIAKLPPAQQANAKTAIDAFDAAAAGIAAVDPTKSTADQAAAAVSAFLGAAAPVVADLPLTDATKAEITTGVAVAKAVIPFIPAMFPPAPVVTPPAPAPTPSPAPAPTPAKPGA